MFIPTEILIQEFKITFCLYHLKKFIETLKNSISNVGRKKYNSNIQIRKVDCGSCEYDCCNNSNSFNILGVHFDIWLCYEHTQDFYFVLQGILSDIENNYLQDSLKVSKVKIPAVINNKNKHCNIIIPDHYQHMEFYYKIVNHTDLPEGVFSFYLYRDECNHFVENQLASADIYHKKKIFLPYKYQDAASSKILEIELKRLNL